MHLIEHFKRMMHGEKTLFPFFRKVVLTSQIKLLQLQYLPEFIAGIYNSGAEHQGDDSMRLFSFIQHPNIIN